MIHADKMKPQSTITGYILAKDVPNEYNTSESDLEDEKEEEEGPPEFLDINEMDSSGKQNFTSRAPSSKEGIAKLLLSSHQIIKRQ